MFIECRYSLGARLKWYRAHSQYILEQHFPMNYGDHNYSPTAECLNLESVESLP